MRIKNKIYHFECQFSNDKTMAFRMFEYDFYIALTQSKTEEEFRQIHFPSSSVVYITNNKKIPDKLEVEVIFPDGQKMVYKVPTVKVQDYEIKGIEEKKLSIFTPFLILRYASRLKQEKEDTKEKIHLSYKEIIEILNQAYNKKELNEFEFAILIEAVKETEEHILKQYPRVKEGVDIMLSETLELKTIKIYQQGKKEGKEEGKEEGIRKIIKLCKKMNLSEQVIIENLMEEYDLTESKAKEYYKQEQDRQ